MFLSAIIGGQSGGDEDDEDDGAGFGDADEVKCAPRCGGVSVFVVEHCGV